MGATEILAAYAADLSYDDLPPEVVHQAKRVILDLIGCSVSGVELPLGAAIIEEARELGGTGPSRILGTEHRVSAAAAAYANGALSDVADWNDMLYVGHPATAAVSAALALGERDQAPGRSVIEGVVAAYEVFGRIGMAVQPSEKRHESLWGMLTWIPFNAAIAGGKVLELDPRAMATAIGAAGAYAPLGGCHKYVETRSDVYHYNHGMTAMAGVLAALNSKRGLTGMNTFLEGDTGFWVLAGSDQCDFDGLDASLADLGSRWWILETLFKRWPANLWVQSYLDILDDLVRQHGITADDVAEIRFSPSMEMLATYQGRGAMDAAFSVLYALAIALIEPDATAAWYADERLHDPAVLDLIDRVKPRDGAANASLIHEFRNYWAGSWMPTQVEVVTRAGSSHQGYATFPRGHAANPMTDDDLVDKFRRATGATLGRTGADRVAEAVWALDQLASVTELTELIGP
ncbi:MAG: MmgE/PrpD family protein [Actinomycetia bacterium]|nr:MmgE/PrpD family protein [Actinomycetes bacterium]MCP3912186.1 MmgE/PrpD family protein [Actinomycetes bacterium]